MSDPRSPGADQSPASAGPGRKRWLLVASLALNLLVLGAFAGAYFFGPRHGPGRWGATPMEFGLMHFSRKLPEERRNGVREVLREGRKAAKPLREDLRKAREAAALVLGSPDYTTEKMQAALEQIGVAEDSLRRNGAAVVVKAIERLTPEDRKSLSEAWTKRLERHDKRRKSQGKESDKDNPDPTESSAP